MSSTQVAVIPANFQLPAHLQTAEAVAAIAAYNAAAAGGIKTGGFPRISIKGSKFHIVKGGETTTIMAAAAPGQPPLPMMILEVVVVSANPNLSKTYYEGDYQPGDDKEPTCSADNGQVPDAHIVNKQSASCASCPQNQWGSKISKMSGKDVKACTDTKRLAVLPAADLGYEALGLSITPSSLGDWGKYVKALGERGIPVNAIVTNLTFDATASFPKMLFSFNRVLSADEYAKVSERAKGDDVKSIVEPVRLVALPATPAPAAPPPAQVPPPVAPPASPVQPVTGFGAAPTAPVAPVQPVVAAEKPKRAQRKQPEAPTASDLSHIPPEILATINILGINDPTAQALIAKYPRPAAAAVKAGESDGSAVAGQPHPAAAAAPTTGFGGATVLPVGATSVAAGTSLKDMLAARLRAGQAQAAQPVAG